MTGILTLSRPKAGVVSTFDAREYSLIDFLPIEYQWTALVQVGLTLRIVFGDGSVIELLNFYSFSLAGDSGGDDHTGALADASGDLLVLTSATDLMSIKEFARSYWTTKSSGYVAVPAFEGHDGEQASAGLIGQNAPDGVPLSFPPSASGGVEFPLPPVPPFFFLPPQVTHPPNNAAVITGDTAGSVVEAGGVTNAIPGVPVVSGDLDAAGAGGPADSWVAVGAPTPSTNGYGTFVMTAGGVWTYTLNNTNAAVDALAVGATLNDSFTVTAVDGTSQRVTITITGANDAPVVTGAVDSGVVTEGPLPAMTATGTIEFGDVDLADAHVASVTPGGSGYLGTFVANVADDSTGDGSGQVSWLFLTTNQLRQSLQAGQHLVQTYTVEIADGHGGTVSQLVTITINGTNDTAVFTGDTAGGVVEAGGVANAVPGIPVATGDLFAADTDNPDDLWEAVGSPATSINGYGSYELTAAGVWTYTLDNSNATVQALNAGQTLTDTFTAFTVDGTGQVVTITINGANDAAVITGTTSGNVTEAGGVNNGTPGTPTATGDLNSTDVDNPSDAWTAVGAPTAGASGYGSYTLTAAGVWTYTLNNSNATVQALNVGQTLTDTFTATTIDGTSQVVTVTIAGANDAPVIGGTTSGNVTEAGGVNNGIPGTPTATGDLNSIDVDNPSDAWTAVGAPTASAGGYGSYTLTAAGAWTYTLDNSNATVQALSAEQTLTDSFTATTVDGTSQLVTITINGANDAAVITGTATGTVAEAGGVNNGTPGTPTATGDLNSTDVDNAADAWTAVGAPAASASGYGSYTLTAAGEWAYALNNSNATVQALNAGDTLTDSFTATTIDGTSQLVTITITGANDAAVISGTTSGNVTEAGGVNNGTPGTPTATGDLNATDVDNPSDGWTAVSAPSAGASGYGGYTLTAAGVWTYTLNNSNATVQALNVGQTLTDSFTATTIDGTSQLVTVTITGANDAAVISGTTSGNVTEAGGVNNATPGTPTATGDLNSTDVDNAADAWTAVSAPTASASGHGSYTLTAAGAWTYTLDNNNATVQALNIGQTLTDTFTATTIDGTAQLVTITIHGTNDAAVITGTATGTVVEAGGVGSGIPGTPVATGNLNSTDVDNPNDTWTAVGTATASTGGYGSYTLTAAGEWTYTLDNSNAAVQALGTGSTLPDSFTVTTIDGTSQIVTITIHGTDDAAVISGDFTGTVLEAGGIANGTPGIPTATGDLDAADVDNPPGWTPVSTPAASTNGYGTYTLTDAGVWIYTLDNSNAVVQALNVGGTLTDTFTAATVGGTQQLVTITIDGANDAAVITGPVTGTVTEAGGVANGTPGTPTATGDLNSADVDNPNDAWTTVGTSLRGASGYGSYTLTAAGVWTYTLDDSNPTVQALNAGQTLTDTFTVTTVDGTSQAVTITIHGADDAAVITGTATGTVVEAGGVANGTPGTPTATGDLNFTDVDSPSDAWTAVGTATASANGYGSYTLSASGVWTYALDNSNATVQALNAGQTLTDTFTDTTDDGTGQLVTITIHGANDAAIITGTATGTVVEAGGVNNGTPGTPTATGDLNSTDVDNPNDAWTAVGTPTASAGGFGSYTLTATGVWAYTLDDNNATVQALNVGRTLTDTFTATTADGTAKLVTIAIHGADDAAVITGTATGTVVEAGGVANGTPGTPTATGDLNSTDVDNAADAWTAIGSPAASASGYGTYTLSATGVWTYTLNNSNAAVQALNAGDTLTDTFAATTVDGTAKLVTITIDGRNDAAVIAGPVTGTVTEAGGIANGTPGTPTATGDLNSTDVDNAADAWTAVATATASANGYGSYTLTPAGAWTYTLNNSNATVQALNAGQTLTDSFTVTTVDGTAQLVTITVNGANDAAVITGTATGTVVEAGGVNNGTPGTPTATGDLNSTDVDNAADAWTAVATATASANGYGSYKLTAAGVWTYTLDNSNFAVQALNAGGTLTDTFTATTVDGTRQLVTITIDGANDAAVISGATSGSVTEAGGVANGISGTPTATGDLNSTDVDNTADAWTAVGTATASANGYGSYTLTAAGLWAYTLDNSNPAVQALNAGGTLTDTFTATTVDGTAQLVTITINGANDAPVITGPVTGTVVEAGGVFNATPGTPTATGDLNSTDVDNPIDAWTAVGAATASGYGSYTLTTAGVWTYTLDNGNATVQALNAGQTLTDTFTVTTVDGTAQLVTITIDGANDAAVISGVASGSVTEAGGVGSGIPGVPIAAGNLDATDVDNPPDAWNAVGSPTASVNGFGTYTLTAAGVWTYILDNSNAAVQALNVGQTLTDTFTATTIDGTSQLVTITIHGTDDAAVISGDFTGVVLEAGGVANTTPGIPTATGDLDAADVDNPPDWVAVGTPAGGTNGFGTYTLTAAGAWTYTLNDSNAAVQALNVGGTLTDAFTATTVGGTSQLVTITIDGANDAAAISGATSGSVTEAGGLANGTPGIPTATGDLNSTDVDNPSDTWETVGTSLRGASGFGTYTLTTSGVWTYTLDDNNAVVQSLNSGQTLTDTFTVATIDGTTQVVTITINGANDAAVISGATSGSVTEAGGVANGTPGTPVATGDLNSADVDNAANAWTAVATALPGDNGFGTYTLTAAGLWTYTLDNSNAAVEALNIGDTLTDTFTATTVDGTAQLVTITINGANDAAVITGDTAGVVVEAGGVANGTSGISFVVGNLDAADVDNPSDSWTVIETPTRSANSYGTFTIDAAGQWLYILDDNNPAVQALNAGDTLTDTFTAVTVDGTAELVTIAIVGANDAAVITGTAAGAVTEAGGVANATPGIPVATGDLNSADVDNTADAWTAVGTATASASGFGTYTLTAAGIWTYILGNTNAAVQALNVGQTLTDSFTAATVDGTAQLVTITINGANDAAVISGDTTGNVLEAGGVANGTHGISIATGHLNSIDVDNPDDAWDAVSGSLRGNSGFGSYTLTAAGVWAYTLDDNNATVQALNAGQTLTDTFTALTVDGTAQLVTITISGANDAAVISGTASGSVIEAGGVANGTPGTPTATGDLDATDVDNPSDAWAAVATALPGDNGFGTYTLTTAGVWSYTLDNNNAAVQALNAGQTLTDTFMVATVDGTTQMVTITIDGANDAAVISGAISRSVIEAGGVNNGTPGIPVAFGNLNSTDVDSPDDAWNAITTPLPGDNDFGAYTLTAAGVWIYILDNRNAAVQALNAGGTLTDTFTAITVDGTRQLVTITINGANDAAVISGVTSGSVTEAGGVANGTPGTPTATGDLNSTDVDNPNDAWTAVGTATTGTSGYGTYTLTAAGVWLYTLNNSSAAVQALNVGDTLTDSFTATTVDGTAQRVTITIHGANDAAVITGTATGAVIEAGGVGSGIPGVPTATGNLDFTDVDNPPDDWTQVATPTPGDNGFGAYTMTAAGVWTYTLDNSNVAVQALGNGATLTDTFTAVTVDGTAKLVTVTIHGTDDAAVISGDFTGAVLEAGGVANGTPGTPTATGDLDAADVDNPPAWTPVGTPTPGHNGFGTYTLTAAGVWTYTLDNANAAVQALNAGQTLTDTFTAMIVDGTTQVVTITINGANDTAVITGTASGTVTEAGGVANGAPGIPTATGDLNSTDVDNPNDLWEPVGTALRGDSGFSTYTVTASGVWTYTLDNSNPAVQALNVGQTLTDTFTVTTVDGTAQLVTITINGSNDAAAISGATSGSVIEAGGVANGTSGTPTATGDLNSTDVDNPNDAWTAVGTATASANGFGTYTLTAAGLWTYTLDNSNAAVQALNIGDTLTDTFTAATVDGTAQLVTITVNGANDAAVISGTVNGSVTEAGGVNNGTPGTPTATGDLNSTDVDNPADTWNMVATPLPTDNHFGTYTLTAAGVWTYTLDNSNPAVQALNVGQTLTDTFTVATIGGTAQLITVTINGANDAAVVTGPVTGTVLEAGGVDNGSPGTPTSTGDLNAADVDNPNGAWTIVATPAASANGFGTYTLTAAGVWTYTLDNTNAAVQGLNIGQALTDSFTATTIDGTARLVTITINGSDDAPVAVTDNNAGDPVTESGVNPGNTPFAGDPSAAGNVLANDVDVDSGDTKTVVAVNGEAVNVGQPLTGTYGTLTLLANGNWSYALDNADPGTNALAQGQVVTDVFTYTMADADGATSSSSLTVAITGTNDPPNILIAGGDRATAILTETGAGLTKSGTLTVQDPDLTDAVTASVAAVTLNGTTGGLTVADVLGMLSVTPGLIATDPGDTNNLGWAFDSGAQAFGFLNAGQTLTLDYTVQATDGSASDTQTVEVTINGAGAAPVAHDDTVLASDATTVIIPWSALLANDSDPSASIVSVTSLIGGLPLPIPVTLDSAAETISFHTPVGTDITDNSFTYTISSDSGTSTASVDVHILPNNGPAGVNTVLSGEFYDFSYFFVGGGNDSLTAGGATDYFLGGAGNDTYQYRLVGGGDDHIDESILGGAGNDTINILTQNTTSLTDLNFQRVDADADGSVDDLRFTYNGNPVTVINEFDAFPNHHVEQLSFTNGGTYFGYALGTGPYSIDNTSGGNDIVAGTSGDDILQGGTGGRELLFGNAGNDTINAGSGDDLLVGGTGNDTLNGGSGSDTYLFGLNDGIDTINENGGTDQIVIAANGAELSSLNFSDSSAGPGGNLVIGYNGQQITVTSQFSGNQDSQLGSLTFFGGASYLGYDLGSSTYTLAGGGTDFIRAGDSGANFLQGGPGRDLIFGNAGNDTIIGGGGTDLLVGGAGNDTLTGGPGDDVLVGGAGNDTLTGGGGNNRYVFAEAGAANVDTITDYSTRDIIDLSPLLDSHFGATDNPADFARLVQQGSNVVVQADLDGPANGHNFVDVAVLSGYGTAAPDLVHVHFGNVTHDLLV